MNMKFWNAGSGKAEDLVHVVKNAETVTIPTGTPVVYAFNGTDDGLAVILPSSSTAAKIAVFQAGVAVHDILPGRMENVQVYGFNRKSLFVRGTRAASTAAWASAAAISIGEVMSINSALNGFSNAGALPGSNQFLAQVVAAEAVASGTTLASSDNGFNAASATVYLQPVKTFLRFM